MLKLLKNEFKNRGKLIGILASLYLIEHIYFIFLKLDKSTDIGVSSDIFIGNFFLSSIIMVTIAFFFSFIDFSKSLNPKPGYMLYMINISKEKIILNKVIYSFIETGILATLSIVLFLVELQYLGFSSYLFGDFDASLFIAIYNNFGQVLLILSYIVIAYILLLVSVMLAISIRKFLIKDNPFSGLITFIILSGLAFVRDFLIDLFSIPLSKSYTVYYSDVNTGVNLTTQSGNISLDIITFDLVLVVIITLVTVHIIKKRLSI